MSSLCHSQHAVLRCPWDGACIPQPQRSSRSWVPTSWSTVSSTNLPSLQKQFLNARTHLGPAPAARLDANHCHDAQFFLTPQWELLPTAVLPKMLQSRGDSVCLTQTFSNTVGHVHTIKSSHSFKMTLVLAITENYWLISPVLFWIYSNENERKNWNSLSLSVNWG